jgi:dihydropteroate synthase
VKAQVAEGALSAGAVMVNDITACTGDPAMPAVIASAGAAVCLMHMQGTPRTMQRDPVYVDVVAEIRQYLEERASALGRAGVARERIVVDPGFGFGKTVEHNLTILRRLRDLASTGYPVLIGTSRKSTIGAVLGGLPPSDRLEGTAATVAIAVANGAAMVRVHDVRAMARVARMADAISRTP